MICFLFVALIQTAEARRGDRPPPTPGGPPPQNGKACRLAKGSIKMPGYPILDAAGAQVGVKRVTILWRYVDANCDGVMTWVGGTPGATLEGADHLRVVPRTIYDFNLGSLATTPDLNNEVQISVHHFGPFDPAIGLSGAFR
ncbi:MAG: hypothetical protein ACE5GQ_06710, partial [Nitrospinales bacterium]